MRQFRKWFPNEVVNIEFRTPYMQPENLCFELDSGTDFGSIICDICDREITVFTDFDHTHYEVYTQDEELKPEQKRMKAVGWALESISELISGDLIVEVEKRNGEVKKAIRYHKDRPDNFTSATVNLDGEPKWWQKIFKPKETIEVVRANWNGIVE